MERWLLLPGILCFTALATVALAHEHGQFEGAISVPAWARSSLRAQTRLQADTPVSRLSLCGANEVFNTLAFSPSKWLEARRMLSASTGLCVESVGQCLRGTANIHSQEYSVQDLLSAGVRRISASLHFISPFQSDNYHFCRGDSHFFTGCQNLQAQLLGIDVCSLYLDVPTLTADSTGCTRTAATLEDGLSHIGQWVDANKASLGYDIIVLDISDYVIQTARVSQETLAASRKHIEGIMKRTLGDNVFTPSELQQFRSGVGVAASDWPTPRQLVDTFNKRVVVLSPSPSALPGSFVHRLTTTRSTIQNTDNSVKNFREAYNNTCDSVNTNEPFQPVYESRKVLLLNETNTAGMWRQTVSTEVGADEFGTISAETAAQIMECGLSPSMDHIAPETIITRCIWTYSNNTEPPAVKSQRVVFNANGGWSTASASAGDALHKACRNNAGHWQLSAAGQPCPEGFSIAVPVSPAQTALLRQALVSAHVNAALLNSNVMGVTQREAGSSSSPSSSSNTVAIAVGAACGVAVIIIVIVVIVVVKRRGTTGGSSEPFEDQDEKL